MYLYALFDFFKRDIRDRCRYFTLVRTCCVSTGFSLGTARCVPGVSCRADCRSGLRKSPAGVQMQMHDSQYASCRYLGNGCVFRSSSGARLYQMDGTVGCFGRLADCFFLADGYEYRLLCKMSCVLRKVGLLFSFFYTTKKRAAAKKLPQPCAVTGRG